MYAACKSCDDAGNFTAAYVIVAGAVFFIIFIVLYGMMKSKEVERKIMEAKERFEKSFTERTNSANFLPKSKQQVHDRFSEKSKAVMGGLHARAETVRRICANKLSILVYTFQVAYQFAKITTGCACELVRVYVP